MEKYWDLILNPSSTNDTNKFRVQFIQTELQNQIQWSLPGEKTQYPLNDIQIFTKNDSTYVFLFPDSSKFQLNLGKKPSSFRLK
jgi:hypothetical protein